MKVQTIEAGSGNADLVQDLGDLSVLGDANQPLLQAIRLDLTKLSSAAGLSLEMSTLLATVNGERAETNESKQLRDKAYTYLKEAMDEIREAGKFVFWKDEKRLKGYKSAYHSR